MAFTVRALDAGPVIAVRKMAIDDEVKVKILEFQRNYFCSVMLNSTDLIGVV